MFTKALTVLASSALIAFVAAPAHAALNDNGSSFNGIEINGSLNGLQLNGSINGLQLNGAINGLQLNATINGLQLNGGTENGLQLNAGVLNGDGTNGVRANNTVSGLKDFTIVAIELPSVR